MWASNRILGPSSTITLSVMLVTVVPFGLADPIPQSQSDLPAYTVTEEKLANLRDIGSGIYHRSSKTGCRFAYTVSRGTKWSVGVDNTMGPAHDGRGRGSLVFSPDGTRVAYLAQREEKWFVVVDGVEGEVHDRVAGGFPVFSPDGRRIAYVACQGSTWFVVVDGKPGPAYDGIGKGIEFSSDGRRVAYAACQDTKWFVVVDGKPGTVYDRIGNRIVVSSDGKCQTSLDVGTSSRAQQKLAWKLLPCRTKTPRRQCTDACLTPSWLLILQVSSLRF